MPHINLGQRKQPEPTLNKKMYQDVYQDPRWKRLRAEKIAANPLCEKCEKKGKVTLTDEVHHIIPFQIASTPEEIEDFAYDWDNLESTCDDCHKEEHKKLRGGRRSIITHFQCKIQPQNFIYKPTPPSFNF